MGFDDDDFSFDNFDFDDDDDLRGDFGDDDVEDTGGGNLDNFEFDDDLGSLDDDIDEMDDLDELDELDSDFNFDEIEEGGGGGPSRSFIIAAAAMIVLFIVALVVVVILATGPKEPSPSQYTASAVVVFNMTQADFATQTEVARGTEVALAETAQAATPTPSVPMVEFAIDSEVRAGPNEVFDVLGMAPLGTVAEVLAINPEGDWYRVVYDTGEGWVPTSNVVPIGGDFNNLSQQTVPLPPTATPTEAPVEPTAIAQDVTQVVETVETPPEISAQEAVAMTATALAGILEPSPTPGTIIQGGGTGGAQAQPTALPDTGLLDDVFGGGSQGLSMFILIALGLVGVIIASRRLRAMNT